MPRISKEQLEQVFPAPPEGISAAELDVDRIPRHVAFIMDGNGRWAKKRGLSRKEGHKAGVDTVREMITVCNDIGVEYLTLYSFSTENWNRPADEVSGLMKLFSTTLLKELVGLKRHGVKIVMLGDMSALPAATAKVFQEGVDETRDDTGMTLALAVNYGGRQEILRSVRNLAEQVADGSLSPEDIGEDQIADGLYTAGMPDPDLVIRTSGESRISNFLLWQVAYSEFYVSDLLWPDFDRYDFLKALLNYQGRQRRYGGV